MKYFHLNLTSNLYLYRSIDHQLIDVTSENYNQYIQSNLIDPNSPEALQNDFLIGYFPDSQPFSENLNENHNEISKLGYNDEIEYEILSNLSSLFSIDLQKNQNKKIGFSFFSDSISAKYHLDAIQRPFFAIFSPKDTKSKFIL